MASKTKKVKAEPTLLAIKSKAPPMPPVQPPRESSAVPCERMHFYVIGRKNEDDGFTEYLNLVKDDGTMVRFSALERAIIYANMGAAQNDIDRSGNSEGCVPLEVIARKPK